MITREQYEKLLPYRDAIVVARSVSGNTAAELREIYLEHGRAVNLHCRMCVGDMFDYFTLVIREYERKANTENT